MIDAEPGYFWALLQEAAQKMFGKSGLHLSKSEKELVLAVGGHTGGGED